MSFNVVNPIVDPLQGPFLLNVEPLACADYWREGSVQGKCKMDKTKFSGQQCGVGNDQLPSIFERPFEVCENLTGPCRNHSAHANASQASFDILIMVALASQETCAVNEVSMTPLYL